MNKKILFLALLTVVLTPALCFAAGSITEIVNNVAQSLVPLAGGLATIAFMVAGIMYIASTANPSLMAHAKTALIAAFIGIAIVILATSAEAFVKTFFGL